MNEIELKFQVPAERRAAVEAAVRGRGGAAALRLQAVYVDTADRVLAQARLALRMRREGRRWVQTLKGAPASDALARAEHEVPVPGRGAAAPAVEAARHRGTPTGERLATLLADRPADALQPVFATDVRRLVRLQRVKGGLVELAFDAGRIAAGGRSVPVCELEIELKRGSPALVIEAARGWVRRHGLWLDTRTKAERGELLARGETVSPVRKPGTLRLPADADAATLRRAWLAHCFEPIAAHAAQIASGEYGDEHVHQLRVGLRRLRSALRLLDDPADVPLAEGAASLFRALSAVRDAAAIGVPLQRELAEALRAVGREAMPPPLPAEGEADDPVRCVRDPAVQAWLLDLLAAIHASPAPEPAASPAADVHAPAAPPLRAHLARRLRRWHRQLEAAAAAYDTLDDDARHTLRKRAKRLRYALELSASLFDGARAERYLERLRRLQDRLGAVNDLAVALRRFGALPPGDPAADFALGWLAARRAPLIAEARPALRRVARARGPWKKR